MATTRADVYAAVDGERDYQIRRWAESSCKGTEHSVTEFLVFMQTYVNEALAALSHEPEPEASAKALHAVRKVTALGVATMERHGAPQRAKP